MAEVVVAIRVVITEFLSDEPQPGIVRCEFTDAHGRRWTFTEKTATVCMVAIDGRDSYPRPGVIMCKVVGRRPSEAGDDVIAVACEYFPDGIESDEDTTDSRSSRNASSNGNGAMTSSGPGAGPPDLAPQRTPHRHRTSCIIKPVSAGGSAELGRQATGGFL